ncbi:hypothetical protein RIF29_26821 [Crotalaria pallida]|uniref:Retrotransposon gag domain-containing protein n=1 Tax=Crotalaria pallida TaxID=3830 RepID=A0AAN9HYA6_CROPI
MLERITTVLEAMQRQSQQPSQPVNPPHQFNVVNAEAKTLADFRSCNPPKFEGGFKPEEANKWIHTMDKILRTLECSDAQKVAYATYMLEDEAESWWNHTMQFLQYEGRDVSWGVFMEKFLQKYFPEDLRRKKEVEFLQLKQGNMSVGEYAAKFEELMKYFPYYQNKLSYVSCIVSYSIVLQKFLVFNLAKTNCHT